MMNDVLTVEKVKDILKSDSKDKKISIGDFVTIDNDDDFVKIYVVKNIIGKIADIYSLHITKENDDIVFIEEFAKTVVVKVISYKCTIIAIVANTCIYVVRRAFQTILRVAWNVEKWDFANTHSYIFHFQKFSFSIVFDR